MIPAEWDRLANYVVAKVKEQIVAPLLDPVVDADGLAQLLKVSKTTIERKTRDGSIPSFQVGDCRRYRVDEVYAALRGPSLVSTTTAAQ